MGDVYRKVKVCGIDSVGKRAACRTVMALLDLGATRSVIGRKLASETGGLILPNATQLEHHFHDLMTAEVRVLAPDCRAWREPIVVDDQLVAKAGPKAEMILGNDYMQERRMAFLLSRDKKDEHVGCRPQSSQPNGRHRKR